MTAFDQALAFTLPQEGGYVNDPNDSGGATNKGVTQATYDAWRDAEKQPLRSVELLTSAEAADLYQAMYWNPGHCADLPLRLAICHFDWTVNHGVSGALKTLQNAVGAVSDGEWGPATGAAVAQAPDFTWHAYINLRRAWYTQRVQQKPDQARFLPGWLNRCDSLQKYLEAL